MIDALKILTDWLGDGGLPVPSKQAESRADVCLSCSFHKPDRWWETAKEKIADVIKLHLETKNQMKISVPQEEKLGMCRACGCCVRLKAHVPIEHIQAHTSKEQKAKYPPWCWVLKEMEL